MKKILFVIILLINFSCDEKLDDNSKTPLRLSIVNKLDVFANAETRFVDGFGGYDEYDELEVIATLRNGFTGVNYTTLYEGRNETVKRGEKIIFFEDLLPANKYDYTIRTNLRTKELILNQNQNLDYYRADYLDNSADSTYLDVRTRTLNVTLGHANMAFEIIFEKGNGWTATEFQRYMNTFELKFKINDGREIIARKFNNIFSLIIPPSFVPNKCSFYIPDYWNRNELLECTFNVSSDKIKAGNKVVVTAVYDYFERRVTLQSADIASSWDNQKDWN
jgi:hypothetical protein